MQVRSTNQPDDHLVNSSPQVCHAVTTESHACQWAGSTSWIRTFYICSPNWRGKKSLNVCTGTYAWKYFHVKHLQWVKQQITGTEQVVLEVSSDNKHRGCVLEQKRLGRKPASRVINAKPKKKTQKMFSHERVMQDNSDTGGLSKYTLIKADIPLVGCLANDTENLFTASIENSSEEIRKVTGVTEAAWPL